VEDALTLLRFARGPGSRGASLCDVKVMPMGAAVVAPIAGRMMVVVPVEVLTSGSMLPPVVRVTGVLDSVTGALDSVTGALDSVTGELDNVTGVAATTLAV